MKDQPFTITGPLAPGGKTLPEIIIVRASGSGDCARTVIGIK